MITDNDYKNLNPWQFAKEVFKNSYFIKHSEEYREIFEGTLICLLHNFWPIYRLELGLYYC